MQNMNYLTITLLMAVESSFIPFPSEIVVPPAAYKARLGELNIYLVVFFSTLGALIGALFNYYLAVFIGRAALYKFAGTRFAHMCMIEPASIEKAEKYFIKHGRSATFIGRLVPGIRQLISIPAGLSRMPMGRFILFTTIGALLWNIILASLGYFVPQEMVEKYYREMNVVLLILGGLFILYLIYLGFFKKQKKASV